MIATVSPARRCGAPFPTGDARIAASWRGIVSPRPTME